MSVNKMVQAAAESNPAAFKEAFVSALNSKIGQAISDRRTDVVAGMFGVNESEEKCSCGKMPKGECDCDKKDA